MYRLGVVSFLNARPLIAGLEESADEAAVLYDVPSRLPEWLASGRLDAALVPIIDVLRSGGGLKVVSDACIACDGETMTVRVFSQVPPDRIERLWTDGDSHTSVALADVLWRELYGRRLELTPFDARHEDAAGHEAVLLIGDKVVDPARGKFAYEVDLGGAWRQHTGLPFVFAVWAAPVGMPEPQRAALGTLLAGWRDRGVARAGRLAEAYAKPAGWPVELARRYLTRCLSYRLDARAVEGAEQFARKCVELGLVEPPAVIDWPPEVASRRSTDPVNKSQQVQP